MKRILTAFVMFLLIGAGVVTVVGMQNDIKKLDEDYSNIAYVKIFEQPLTLQCAFTSDAYYFDGKIKVYDNLWGIDGDIVKLTWWGIASHWVGNEFINGTPEGMNFKILFYDDPTDPVYAPPVELIKSFDFSAEDIEVTHTGELYISPFTGNVREVIKFDCLLPSPLSLSDWSGWVSIQSYNDTENDVFLWLSGNGLDNFTYQENGNPPKLHHDRSICFYREDLSPEELTITGEVNSKAGTEYEYTFVATDPEGDEISYFIDWGDNNNSGWLGPYSSGEEIIAKHNWTEQGDYTIKAKVKDTYGAESDWATFEVNVTKSKVKTIDDKENIIVYESRIFGIGFVRIHPLTHLIKGFVLFGFNEGRVIKGEFIIIEYSEAEGVFAGYLPPLVFFIRYNLSL